MRARLAFSFWRHRFAGWSTIFVCLLSLWPFAATRAQAPDVSIHAVTIFDVSPAVVARGGDLAKRYREGLSGLPGFNGALILREVGRPNWFTVDEGWKDQASFDASGASAPVNSLRVSLRAMDRAPFDRRDYAVISTGPSQPLLGAGVVHLHLHLDVFPPGINPALAATRIVAEAARMGQGNLRYDVYKSVETPVSHFTILGAWRSRADFDAYESSPYGRAFRDAVGPLLGSPIDDRLKTAIE